MTRADVLSALAAHRGDLSRYAVGSLTLFGSVARDEAGPESDVDLLVEFAVPATFDLFMDLKFHIEALLGAQVDLVTTKALRPQLRPQIEREGIRVA